MQQDNLWFLHGTVTCTSIWYIDHVKNTPGFFYITFVNKTAMKNWRHVRWYLCGPSLSKIFHQHHAHMKKDTKAHCLRMFRLQSGMPGNKAWCTCMSRFTAHILSQFNEYHTAMNIQHWCHTKPTSVRMLHGTVYKSWIRPQKSLEKAENELQGEFFLLVIWFKI